MTDRHPILFFFTVVPLIMLAVVVIVVCGLFGSLYDHA